MAFTESRKATSTIEYFQLYSSIRFVRLSCCRIVALCRTSLCCAQCAPVKLYCSINVVKDNVNVITTALN